MALGMRCLLTNRPGRVAPFRSTTRQSTAPVCTAVHRLKQESTCVAADRRAVLQLGGLISLGLVYPDLAQAAGKVPKGFAVLKDTNDGYSFLYPFGWQELTVDGQDVVLKDVIEPLESVSVNLLETQRETIREFGEIKEVAYTLADKVLTGPQQAVTIVSTTERADNDGRTYYEFEFTVDAGRYQRHSLAVVTVGNGKFYTLTTGSNQRRWDKMKDKLETVVKSFEVFPRYNS